MGTFAKCNCPQCNEPAKSEMDMDDILPCPWFGERKPRISKDMSRLECSQCGASILMPDGSADDALDAWNDRAKLWEPKAK